ncbi:MAG: hypothetical protein ACI4PG_13340 [Candidatus Ventricola sp.]
MDETTREAVVAALSAIRCDAAGTEDMLHEQAARALEAAGIAAQHEARLAPRCRIDFLAGTIGIEIKKSRPRSGALLSQLRRYAACEQVAELVVMAPRGVNLPRTIGGKRVTMLSLERLWGISLP